MLFGTPNEQDEESITHLKNRWELSLSLLDLEQPSPFGLFEGRQDFRGAAFTKGRSIPKKVTFDSLDLSFSSFATFRLLDATLNNIVAHSATFNDFKLFKSHISDCIFVNCDLSSSGAGNLTQSTILNSTFQECTGAPELLGGVRRVEDSEFLSMDLQNIGDLDPVRSPTIQNTRFTGKLRNSIIQQGRGEQQLKGCDISELKLKNVQLMGVNMDDVKCSSTLQPFLVPNWSEQIEKLHQVGAEVSASSEREVSVAGDSLQRAIKADDKSSYWIKNRWPRGTRYAYELDPQGPLRSKASGQIRSLYERAGVENCS